MREADPGFWNGKRVWIVGGSTGIGRAIAVSVARAGATVVASARSGDALDELAEQVAGAGGALQPLLLDVTDAGQITRAVEQIDQRHGGLDVLIYSAGAWDPVDLPTIDADSAARQMAVNFEGLVRCVAAAFPSMAERRSGLIAGIASASAYAPLPRAEAYGASKAAVVYFLQSLRIDAKRFGVRVATVAPGFVETPLTGKNDFKMPFMIPVEDAASDIVAGLQSGREEIHSPKRLTVPLKLLGALPRPIKERIVARIFRR